MTEQGKAGLDRHAKAVEATVRYAIATAEIRALTKKLGSCDENGMSDLNCLKRGTDEQQMNGLTVACRKWTYEGSGDDGESHWTSHRPREEWCGACVLIQEIVDQRKAARRRRASALTALSNIGRALLKSRPAPASEEKEERTE